MAKKPCISSGVEGRRSSESSDAMIMDEVKRNRSLMVFRVASVAAGRGYGCGNRSPSLPLLLVRSWRPLRSTSGTSQVIQ